MNLVERSSHFEFGENWKDYSKSIDKTRVDQAVAGIQKLFPEGYQRKNVSRHRLRLRIAFTGSVNARGEIGDEY
jgi:hypothetical protein